MELNKIPTNLFLCITTLLLLEIDETNPIVSIILALSVFYFEAKTL